MPIMFRVSETLEAMVCPVKQCTHARSLTAHARPRCMGGGGGGGDDDDDDDDDYDVTVPPATACRQ